MDGNINMRDESMNLRIHPHTKGFRIISLRSPLYVRGTFMQPHVGVEPGALIARGGVAVGLGLLNPFASLIALLQPSNNRSLPRQRMLADFRQRPTAPEPGVRQKAKEVPAYMKAASGVLVSQLGRRQKRIALWRGRRQARLRRVRVALKSRLRRSREDDVDVDVDVLKNGAVASGLPTVRRART